MIKCIIWDVGQAILRYNYPVVLACLARLSGKNPEDVKALIGGKNFEAGTLINLLDSGKIGKKRFIRSLRRRLKIDSRISNKLLRECFTRCFEIPNNTRTLLHFLSEHYKQGVISNMNPIQWEYIQKTFPTLSENGNIFSFFVLSYREKVLKPDDVIYATAFQKAWWTCGGDIKPWECVFIDDRVENVNAARAFGMEGIHIENPDDPDLRERLASLKIFLPLSDYYPPGHRRDITQKTVVGI